MSSIFPATSQKPAISFNGSSNGTAAPTASHNLTLPSLKKSPISHLDDMVNDEYAMFRLLFVLVCVSLAVALWVMYKIWKRKSTDSDFGVVQYAPLSRNTKRPQHLDGNGDDASPFVLSDDDDSSDDEDSIDLRLPVPQRLVV